MLTKMEVSSDNPNVPPLPLGGFMPNEDPVQIFTIDGLGPVQASVNSSPFATGRGELFQGSSIPKRNIVMTLGLNPNWKTQTMSSLRQLLYAYFMPQQWVTLRFFSSDMPTVQIRGIVESFDPSMFSEDPEIQISVLCNKPDFIEVDQTTIAGVVDDGTDSYVINYTGSIPVGFQLQVRATEDVDTYFGGLSIRNHYLGTDQVFEVDDVDVSELRYFKLGTVKTSREVVNVHKDDADFNINLLAKVTLDSIWPELGPGENVFSVVAPTPGQAWYMGYFNRYGGL